MGDLLYENKKYIVYCKKLICDEIEVEQPAVNTVPYASVAVQDALLPQGTITYSGVFPINFLQNAPNSAVGFVNNANGLIYLDANEPFAREGAYLITWKIRMACDNITEPVSIGNGEIAALRVRDGESNVIYNRGGIGGYYASKPGISGPNSVYVTMCGSFVANLLYGDGIGLQALNILNTNQYKYNLSFTASFVNL